MKEYLIEEAGIKFKYPEEFGQPYLVPNTITDEHQIFITWWHPDRKDPKEVGFSVSAVRYDHYPPRESGVLDFRGFGGDNNWFKTPEEFCEAASKESAIFCSFTNNRLDFLLGEGCSEGMPGLFEGGGFTRGMILDRPNNDYRAANFIGHFYNLEFPWKGARGYDYLCEDYNDLAEINIKTLNKAMLERRLDEKIMRQFDMFEKVFETVEEF